MSIWEITVSRGHPYMGRNFLEIVPASRNVQVSDPESASAILSAVRKTSTLGPGAFWIRGCFSLDQSLHLLGKQFLF